MKKCLGILACLALCAALMFGLYAHAQIEARAAGQRIYASQTAKNARGTGGFSSHLPVVRIDTGDGEIEKSIAVWCRLEVIDNTDDRNYITDTPAFKTDATIHYRGNSSYGFDKKQYRLEFYESQDDGGPERNIPVMGMQPQSDWVLNGPYQDKALMRNKLSYDVARTCMAYAPDTRYCEVFVNGEYMGVYVMTESVKVCPERIALSDYSLLGGQTPYLILRERSYVETQSPAVRTFGTAAGKADKGLFIRYPKIRTLTNVQKSWIEADISKLERALYSDAFDDPALGYMRYIDLDSFATYYVLNEFAINDDAGYHSTYCYKDFNGRLIMGPVWDFNSAYDNYADFKSYADQFYMKDNNWFARLTQDRAFVDAVVKKYRELRRGALSYESLVARIDANVAALGDAAERNFEKWGDTFELDMLASARDAPDRNLRSFEEAVAQLKGFIRGRGEFLDANIEKLFLYCINR